MFKLKWKLLPVLFTLFLFNSAYAQSVKIDLSVKNESLRQFIKQIETKTDYTFMLDQTVDQSQKVTVDARQESLDAILKKELHQVIDWSRVDKEDYLLAMERSPVKDVEIKALLHAALTEKINDREVYMKGIDASYHYEGYYVFKTEDLT